MENVATKQGPLVCAGFLGKQHSRTTAETEAISGISLLNFGMLFFRLSCMNETDDGQQKSFTCS